MEDPVKLAEAAWYKANKALSQAEDAIKTIEQRRIKEFQRQLEVELAPARAARAELDVDAGKAKEALDAAKAEAAKLTPCEHGPAGTPMVEWKDVSERWARARKLVPSGRKGVIAIWDRSSEHADNKQWGLPQAGEYYVRILKKDGTPSKQFETLSTWRSTWLPEGQEPAK